MLHIRKIYLNMSVKNFQGSHSKYEYKHVYHSNKKRRTNWQRESYSFWYYKIFWSPHQKNKIRTGKSPSMKRAMILNQWWEHHFCSPILTNQRKSWHLTLSRVWRNELRMNFWYEYIYCYNLFGRKFGNVCQHSDLCILTFDP